MGENKEIENHNHYDFTDLELIEELRLAVDGFGRTKDPRIYISNELYHKVAIFFGLNRNKKYPVELFNMINEHNNIVQVATMHQYWPYCDCDDDCDKSCSDCKAVDREKFPLDCICGGHCYISPMPGFSECTKCDDPKEKAK